MVQHVLFQCRFPHDRMVRDKRGQIKKKNAKQQKQNGAPNELVPPQQVLNPEQKTQDGAEGFLEVLDWRRLENLRLSDEKLDSWLQTEADPANWRTHVRPFTSPEEYKLVKLTHQQLQHSSYYWGSMSMQEAHKILRLTSAGTFLIRDSGQTDVFFTLSYHSDDGPTSIRVVLRKLLFNLLGSQKTFPSLFDLLAYYSRPSCKLTTPYRRQRPERLKQICRRALVCTYGAENVRTLDGLSREVKDYVQAYPYSI
ncbi:suppressor of cytokine signaling 1-like [Corythoichthys intestinalis]|uniref:suppressor of cytokine signaling 1-like n=1 Tax=Corythoichthys intestinalis TaxID=161448 RepID=UPI0025A4D38C|nr:suppressor of cytokine signaling 1-like [Corythoichthys intestinalis]XP_061791387.1 suppressor of cytokine signaling 1-like [Nerophis lumbriciformis]